MCSGPTAGTISLQGSRHPSVNLEARRACNHADLPGHTAGHEEDGATTSS